MAFELEEHDVRSAGDRHGERPGPPLPRREAERAVGTALAPLVLVRIAVLVVALGALFFLATLVVLLLGPSRSGGLSCRRFRARGPAAGVGARYSGGAFVGKGAKVAPASRGVKAVAR